MDLSQVQALAFDTGGTRRSGFRAGTLRSDHQTTLIGYHGNAAASSTDGVNIYDRN